MPDERMESMRRGIGAPPESPSAQRAAHRRQERLAALPPLEGGLGGTSDAETAADEAQMDAALRRGLAPEPDVPPDGPPDLPPDVDAGGGAPR